MPEEQDFILRSLTEIELASGRNDEALAWNDKALALIRVRGRAEGESTVLLLRAEILKRSHRSAEAAKALEGALEAARNSSGEYQQALVEEALAGSDLEARRPDRAAAHFEAAARLFQAAGAKQKEATSWVSLFNIYSALESSANAEAALEKMRALSLASDSALVAALVEFVETSRRFQDGKAGLDELRGKLSKLLAVPELSEGRRAQEGQRFLGMVAGVERALEESKKGADSPRDLAPGSETTSSPSLPNLDSTAWADLLRGVELFRNDDFATARDLFLSILARDRDPEMASVVLLSIALSYLAEANGDEAIRYLIRAVDEVEKNASEVQLDEFLSSYLGGHQDLFSMLTTALAASGRIEEAFDYAERARSRAFLQDLGNLRIDPIQGADADLVHEAEVQRRLILDIERRRVEAATGENDRRSEELRQARGRYQALLVRLKVSSAGRAARAKIAPLPLQAIRGQLDSSATLISYYVSDFHVQAWVIDRERVDYLVLPFDPRDLNRLVCWAEQVGHRSGSRGLERLDPSCKGGIGSAEEAYQKLFAPLRGFVRHPRLILVPHGVLHAVPFGALRDPQSDRYLLEDYTLSYAPSASALGLLRARESPVAGAALVLGAPGVTDRTLPPLPAARQEAQAVARLLGTKALLGERASEGRLFGLSGKVDLIHIAAHGLYEPRSPLFSRIALAADSGHDGNLEVHEILAGLDLTGVNLVVLSACGTARGERSKGDEVTGLTRAFLYAGSPGVISTLWNIDDRVTSSLMQDFYRRLLTGAPVAEALRQAQLGVLHDRRTRDPYLWAAFSLTGDPQGRWKAVGSTSFAPPGVAPTLLSETRKAVLSAF
jgi:CHAT domain-containing protein/soluble cytochrome b562